MFIDVTRYGGLRIVRVAVAAIAYVECVEGGSSVHLIGGETVRVNEDPPEIERRIEATFVTISSVIEAVDCPTLADVVAAVDGVKQALIEATEPLRTIAAPPAAPEAAAPSRAGSAETTKAPAAAKPAARKMRA